VLTDWQQSTVLQELGADEVIDYRQQSVDQVFKDNPFDAVVDQIGGESWSPKLHLIWMLLLLLLLLLLFGLVWSACAHIIALCSAILSHI